MSEYRTEPLIVPFGSGLLPEGERDRRVALTSFRSEPSRPKVPTREVECYECGRRSHVPTSAMTATCIHCHAALQMHDVELKADSSELTVRTLGDVTVAPDAQLSQLSIVCRNMTVFGKISGSLRCTGQLRFRESVVLTEPLRARRIVVDCGYTVECTAPVSALEVEVYGRLKADIRAAGVIRVMRGALLCGACEAKDIVVEPGGHYERVKR